MMTVRISAADDAPRSATRLGRVRAFMSPETSLNFFLQNVHNAHVTWTSDNPIQKWYNVRTNDPSILRLEWMSLGLSGNLSWAFVPNRVVDLKLQNNRLEGSIDPSVLPPTLSILWLNRNKFSGELDLTSLPAGLTQLCVNQNNLSGSLNLQHLPLGLTWLWLNTNHFSGTVSLNGLPETLKELYLGDNELEGTVDVGLLPFGMNVISLHGQNKFHVVGVHTNYRHD
mmetsp:Transcript_32096/g.43957  ORF Transcript_32096/g.43957 Transcript_32096/m.43957 type:complete len:227 (+) Transcript_32096:14-694(+)